MTDTAYTPGLKLPEREEKRWKLEWVTAKDQMEVYTENERNAATQSLLLAACVK